MTIKLTKAQEKALRLLSAAAKQSQVDSYQCWLGNRNEEDYRASIDTSTFTIHAACGRKLIEYGLAEMAGKYRARITSSGRNFLYFIDHPKEHSWTPEERRRHFEDMKHLKD